MLPPVLPAADPQRVPSEDEQQAAETIQAASIAAHIQFLASDLLEGRGPGSRGDQLAQQYLATHFKSLGFEAAAPEGGFFQSVPLIGVTTRNPAQLEIRHGDKTLQLKHFDDFILNSGRPVPDVVIENAPLVFVGYGIVAPEYDWNDFKDVDLRGKVLVMMNNDPASDPELFAGKRRLYYGRWDYKYASAARQGAVGAIIIHTTPSAGYPYQVIQTSWSGEEFELRDRDGPHLEMRGWFSEGASRRVFQFTGHDLDDLRAKAEHRDFRPVPLNTTLSVALKCDVREQETANVLARMPGSDPALADEAIILMAHHDHLGLAASRDERGDNIYNGAIDNASGSAVLLNLAHACAGLRERPRRSLLFAAVGAEEQGLLGSEYFAAHPSLPRKKLAAVINVDGINFLGRTHDVNVIGLGKSSLDRILESVANWQGRIITSDHFPDRGYYYRSDQFSLAKIGVPGVYLHSGVEVIGKPEGWGREQLDAWVEKNYHQPSDEYREDWDLSGAVEDARLLFHVGIQAANDEKMPAWTPGDEFEAAR